LILFIFGGACPGQASLPFFFPLPKKKKQKKNKKKNIKIIITFLL